MKRIAFILAGGIALGITGCTLAPKYTRPAAPVPNQWPSGDAFAHNQPSPDAVAAVALGWREFITDAKLQQVIALALANNRDLRLAALNVEMSRALYGIQRDALFPAITATGSANKQRASGDLTDPGRPRISESYSANLGVLSWEVDLFGRIRSLKDEALATYMASAQARRGAQTLLVSGVASAYLALAADIECLALSEHTLRAQEKSFELVQKQFDAGIATKLDLRLAQVPLETARADFAKYTRLVAQDENALALLLGAPLPTSLRPAQLADVASFREVGAGLPSDVLLNRPDVLQAEGQLRAANADLGAARAAFFPRISLTSTLGSASNELSGLFESGTRTWNFSPSASMPIFDARTWTAHRASKVQRKLALTGYEKAIQSAFREVADVLAARGTLDQQVAAQERLVEALSESHRLASARFEKGVDSYLVVLDAQRSLFGAQQGLVALRMARLATQVQLYAALGGGGDEVPVAKATEAPRVPPQS